MNRSAVVALVAVLVLAGVIGYLYVRNQKPAPPVTTGLFSARVSPTSFTNIGPAPTLVITPDGTAGTFNVPHVGLVTLTTVVAVFAVENKNVGNITTIYTLTGAFKTCAVTPAFPNQGSPCQTNSLDGTYRVTFVFGSSAPTGTQSGNNFTSNDWYTGASSTITATVLMDNALIAANLAPQGDIISLGFNIGNVNLSLSLVDLG